MEDGNPAWVDSCRENLNDFGPWRAAQPTGELAVHISAPHPLCGNGFPWNQTLGSSGLWSMLLLQIIGIVGEERGWGFGRAS